MPRFNFETETTEYKKSLTEKNDGYRALVAMLNKHGVGTVYFGIDNDGEIVGVEIGKNTLRTISQEIYNQIQPQVIPEIQVHESDGKRYISVSVKGDQRPYAKDGEYLIRSGEENRAVPPVELRRMFQSSSDLLKETPASKQDLTFDELMMNLKSAGHHVDDQDRMVRSLGLTCLEGKYSMEAELLSDQNPFVLTIAIFEGTDRLSLSYRTDFSGHSIIEEVKSVINYIESLNETKVDMSSFIRKDEGLFDFNSFKEAWINAAVHNTWVLGIPPSIQIFDDRMEIISNGSIPYGQTMEEFYEGVSMPVNESLMRAFIAVDLCEHTGHGVPVILNRYGKEAFNITGSSVRVIIPFSRNRFRIKQDEQVQVLSDKERTVLSMLRTNPNMTVRELSDLSGINSSNVLSTISVLKSKGLLTREGSKKKGRWIVTI